MSSGYRRTGYMWTARHRNGQITWTESRRLELTAS
jgi:hypothetical protein